MAGWIFAASLMCTLPGVAELSGTAVGVCSGRNTSLPAEAAPASALVLGGEGSPEGCCALPFTAALYVQLVCRGGLR